MLSGLLYNVQRGNLIRISSASIYLVVSPSWNTFGWWWPAFSPIYPNIILPIVIIHKNIFAQFTIDSPVVIYMAISTVNGRNCTSSRESPNTNFWVNLEQWRVLIIIQWTSIRGTYALIKCPKNMKAYTTGEYSQEKYRNNNKFLLGIYCKNGSKLDISISRTVLGNKWWLKPWLILHSLKSKNVNY